MNSSRGRSFLPPAANSFDAEEITETRFRRDLLPAAPLGTEATPKASPDALRIALVADTLIGWIGGGVISGRRFVDKLREKHRVTVVGAALPENDPDHVQMPGFQLPFRAMREMQFTMARPDRDLLRDAFAEVDIVHLHFPFWLSYAALDEARALGRPVVASFHVQPENALLNVGVQSPTLNRAMYKLWVDRLYNKADVVVCPSPFAERKLRQHGLTAPTVVVSNGAAPDLKPGALDGSRRGASPDGKVTVLSVGRFAVEKRHDILVDAVARARHRDRIQLVLAGPGTLDPKIRQRAESLPNKPEIGFVSRERLQELYESADIFVHASDIELEGMSCVEAMSFGLPLVVSDSSENAAADFAIDERFKFASGDPQSLADRLDALIEQPSALREAGPRYAEVARGLDFGQSVERLVDVYRSLLASKGSAVAV